MKTEGYIEAIDTFTLQWHQKQIENGGRFTRNLDKQKLKRKGGGRLIIIRHFDEEKIKVMVISVQKSLGGVTTPGFDAYVLESLLISE